MSEYFTNDIQEEKGYLQNVMRKMKKYKKICTVFTILSSKPYSTVRNHRLFFPEKVEQDQTAFCSCPALSASLSAISVNEPQSLQFNDLKRVCLIINRQDRVRILLKTKIYLVIFHNYHTIL